MKALTLAFAVAAAAGVLAPAAAEATTPQRGPKLITSGARADHCTTGYLCLYWDQDYNLDAGPDRMLMTANSIRDLQRYGWASAASSVCNYGNVDARLYAQRDYRGRAVPVRAGQCLPAMPTGWNDRALSVRFVTNS